MIETKKEYETAIEVALGNTIQNIVTDNVESSKEIINYLKTNKLGRVTTLPLSALEIKDNSIYEEAKKETGVIDIAINLVNFATGKETMKFIIALSAKIHFYLKLIILTIKIAMKIANIIIIMKKIKINYIVQKNHYAQKNTIK